MVRTSLAFVVLLLLWTPVRADQTQLNQTRRDLEQVRQRIESTSEELEGKKAAARKLAGQLNQVDRDLRRSRTRLDQAKKELSRLDKDIRSQKKAVATAKKKNAGLEKQVRERLVVLYKGGETQLVKVLFSAQSPATMAEDYDFFQRMVRKDRELLEEYRVQLNKTEQKLVKLAELQTQQKTTLTRRKEQEKSLRKAQQQKQRLLVQIRQDEEALAVLLHELEEKAARLSGLVTSLKKDRPAAGRSVSTRFKDQRGRLPWPINGPIRIGFGTGRHPELGTRYESRGIEVGVTGKKPIRAVWDGHVIFANPFRGYGNLLIVDHGDGYYTLYAQASQLKRRVGERVERGEEIALSGFEGTDVVYFEIRKGGTPLDPLRWLAKKRR